LNQNDQNQNFPLGDIKVLEISEGVAGPHCGRYLSALGAEVVKIEMPPNGDWARNASPFLSGPNEVETGSLFAYNNPGKKSVLLDWKTAEGLSFLDNIVGRFDVLIEDWDLNTREAIGIDKDRFTSINDRLLDISITPFGLEGPYSRWSSSPIIQLALGGYLYLTGSPGKEPLMLPGHQPDYLTGLNASNAVHIALWERERSGKGQFLEMSMMETLATLHQFTYEMFTFDNVLRNRNGNQWQKQGSFASYGISTIKCKDGYLCIGVSGEDQWERLCLMIEREDLIKDPNFDTRQKRAAQADKLDAIVIDWVGDRSRFEIFKESSEVWGIPTAPVLNMAEILKDDQFLHKEIFEAPLMNMETGALFPTFPFKATELQPELGKVPELGTYTEEFFEAMK
jgi:CoA:oxalate CoA-transferase